MSFQILSNDTYEKHFSNINKMYGFPITLDKMIELSNLFLNFFAEKELMIYLTKKYYVKITTNLSDQFYVKIELIKISDEPNIKLLKLLNNFFYSILEDYPIIIIINDYFHIYSLNKILIDLKLKKNLITMDLYKPIQSINLFSRVIYNGESLSSINNLKKNGIIIINHF